MESQPTPQATSLSSGSPPLTPRRPLRAQALVFFYTGENPHNKSGVSWKVWQIARHGRQVTACWGSATLEKRRPVPTGKLRTKTWHFATEKAAVESERRRIREKVRKGYYRQHL